MRFDLLTIFPEFFGGPIDHGMIRRARQQALISIDVHDLRSFTDDRHHIVDDRPFGGGDGMVLKPEPIFRAVEHLRQIDPTADESATCVLLLSPQGTRWSQQEAIRMSRQYQRLILICGRYEGVDERVVEHLVTEEVSIGDYVLTGGELPALVVIDAVTRLLPGVLGSETSAVHDSFSEGAGGLLDSPHYTRPASFRGWSVPQVLISGHHGEVARWRRQAALRKTLLHRPDLLTAAALSPQDRAWLASLAEEERRADGSTDPDPE